MITVETTLRDIANELNLSAQTVSRSLRHDTGINPATRARVHETARRLGYKGRPGRPRRSVDENAKTRVLGLLVRHHNLDELPENTNLMKMMAGIMSVADENGMHLQVHPLNPQKTGRMAEDASLIPPMIETNLCQALIVHGEQDESDLDFLSHRVPIVSMGRIYRNLHIDAAVADNAEGIHTLVTYLVEMGHRNLAWVGPPYNATFMSARESGFIQGCRTHGLTLKLDSFFGADIYGKNGIEKAEPLLAAVDSGVTAFVCGNDAITWQVIQVLEAAGHRIPENISVTGFDAGTKSPLLRQATGIDPNFVEIGKAAAQMVMQRLANVKNEPRIVTVRGKLVVGNTTAPPA